MALTSGMIGLCVDAFLAIGGPFLVYFVLRRRLTLSAHNIAVGAICFVLFALVIEQVFVAYVLIGNPASAAWFKAHKIALAIFGALAAGMFEETARLLAFSFWTRKQDGAGAALAYGIGHGGAEAIILGGLLSLLSLALAALYQNGALNSLLSSRVPPATFALLHDRLAHLTFWTALPAGIERLSALTFQIGLSFLVWRAVVHKEWPLYFLAILAHATLDTPVALFQIRLLHLGVWQLEGGYAVLAVVTAVILVARLPAKRATAR